MSQRQQMREEEPEDGHHQVIDFVVTDMTSADMENKVMAVLSKLKGVVSVHIAQNKASISYDPSLITKEKLRGELEKSGYLPAVFHDTKTGESGVSCNAEDFVPRQTGD